MFDYRLALFTGVDIPIPELQLAVHQPTIREISMIGEDAFFTGVQLLCVNKDLYIEDKSLLQQTTNFQIFMTMINEKELADKKGMISQVVELLFPGFKISFTPNSMFIGAVVVDENNFETLQAIVEQMFCLNKSTADSPQLNYNPANERARQIAQKLLEGRRKAAALNAAKNKGSMFSQYLSILIVALGSLSPKDAMDLTVYQVHDLVERYSLYLNWDLDARSRLAGGKPDKPAENWMKNIHN